MQISYAQNMEDYHLDLVLGDRPAGTYIDVGGGHPVADNVSFWFYLKGWRGLVVEPQETLAAIYAGVRPRDHVVSCLAGREAGEVDFHVVERMHGFSTTVAANAASASGMGAAVTTIAKPVRRLSDLCAEAGLSAVDFLKIDVEGAEADVIAGIDVARVRPRVVVVEAVAPGSMGPAWDHWEPALLGQGYRFAFFDRLNRFYVANEEAELAARFPPEPAAWDGVQHLWDFGRAPERADHPDHAFAKVLQAGMLAELPLLPPEMVARIVARGLQVTGADAGSGAAIASLLSGTAEFPRAEGAGGDLEDALRSEPVRAAIGRIACTYDGGHIMD